MENTAYIERGALWLILHASRIVGIAPLCITSFRNGYNIKVSRFVVFYSYLFITILNIGVLEKLVLVLDISLEATTLLSRIAVFGFEDILDLIIIIIIVEISCLSSTGRMKHMIQHLNLLNKIKVQMYNIQEVKSQKNFIICLFGAFVVEIGTILVYISRKGGVEIYKNEDEYSYIILDIITSFEYMIILILQVQVLLIQLEITTVLNMMNAKMKSLINTSKTDYTSATIKDGVRVLMQSYVSICDVTTKSNNSDGFIIFLIFNRHILTFITTVFDIISSTVANFSDQQPLSIYYIFFCLFATLNIVIFVTPNHEIKQKTLDLQVDLCYLMDNMRPLGSPIPTDLIMFHKQFILNEPDFSSLGILTLNRTFVSSVFSGGFTYILLLLHLRHISVD